MRIKHHRHAALCGALLALGGCGDTASPPAPAQTSSGLPGAVAAAKAAGVSVDPAIVAADNGFGLRLLGELTQASANSNVAIAPVSVALTLQIAWNGSAGTTQQAMAQTLGLGALTAAQLNEANAALEASLIDADPAVTLNIANSLWMHLENNPVLPAFTQMDQTYYGAEIGDLAGAPADVNAWIARATGGLITQLLPAGNYSQVVAVLANAVYFKAQWTYAFDPRLTVPDTFTTSEGAQAPVEMMQQTGTYAYVAEPNFQAVRLPYGGGRFSMLLMLPQAGTSVAALVAGLSAQSLSEMVAQMQPVYGAIALPRFTATFSATLDAPLAALGMGTAFCPEGDLSGIAPGACISHVGHATVVEVDESGTVAAGSTVVVVPVSVVQDPVFTMTMNHPFLYAIRDEKSGELLFVGVLENPT